MPFCENQIRPGRADGLQTSGAQGLARVRLRFIATALVEIADQGPDAVFRGKNRDVGMADDQDFLRSVAVQVPARCETKVGVLAVVEGAPAIGGGDESGGEGFGAGRPDLDFQPTLGLGRAEVIKAVLDLLRGPGRSSDGGIVGSGQPRQRRLSGLDRKAHV